MKRNFWQLIVVLGISGTAGYWLGAPTSEMTEKQAAVSQRASVAIKSAECERRGFYANEKNGSCTDIPLPAMFR